MANWTGPNTANCANAIRPKFYKNKVRMSKNAFKAQSSIIKNDNLNIFNSLWFGICAQAKT
jgi:hypothetical protein